MTPAPTKRNTFISEPTSRTACVSSRVSQPPRRAQPSPRFDQTVEKMNTKMKRAAPGSFRQMSLARAHGPESSGSWVRPGEFAVQIYREGDHGGVHARRHEQEGVQAVVAAGACLPDARSQGVRRRRPVEERREPE